MVAHGPTRMRERSHARDRETKGVNVGANVTNRAEYRSLSDDAPVIEKHFEISPKIRSFLLKSMKNIRMSRIHVIFALFCYQCSTLIAFYVIINAVEDFRSNMKILWPKIKPL